MKIEINSESPDAVLDRMLRSNPRNIWTKFRAALMMMDMGHFDGAERLLDGLRYHPDARDGVFSIFWSQLAEAKRQHGAASKIQIPADYHANRSERILLPFRELKSDHPVPKNYPWGLVLPQYAGTGNAYRFLQEAGTALAGGYVPAIRRVHVIWSPLEADGAAQREVLAGLAGLSFAGRIDLTVFGCETLPAGAVLPGGGEIAVRPFGVQTPPGNAEVHRIALDCDLMFFLTGAARLDGMLLQRALQLAEISDSVLQPLAPIGRGEASKTFETLYSDAPVRGLFNGLYPFREVLGLNLMISARKFREIGNLDLRLAGTHSAAIELAYRAFVRGAWLVPLTVPALTGHSDRDAHKDDKERLVSLCPNHWDRKRDQRHEVPRVSIYIPAYNASKYIERAVDSVLSQNVADLDVCIANDGSSDGTIALLERLYSNEKRVRWIDNRNGGIGFASNSAIRMSKSLYIGQLDSDDCLKPGAVQRLMRVLDDNPSVVCAYASCERIDAAGNYTKDEYSWPVFSREKMMITSIAHHFRMFRRQAWERTSRFREDIVNGVDYDIFLKMSELGEFRHIDEKFYQRRWHGENTSHVNEHHQTANTYRVQRESLGRMGLAKFWDVHVPDPKLPRAVTYRLRPGTKVVMFWPNYSRANPYQKLLYGKLRQTAEVLAGNIDAVLKLVESNLVPAEDVTFHLHWLNFLFEKYTEEAALHEAAEAFFAKVERFIAKGGRFIWSIHNITSHDSLFPEIERDLSARLAAIAHCLHFHSGASLPEVEAQFPVDRAKVRVSRHGSYVGAYPDFITRDAAREALGIGKDEDVILFTGQIRAYKGVDSLITAFRRILADRPNLRLLLAGPEHSDPLVNAAEELTEAERARIISSGRFVEDGEFQVFFRAADLAAYPYQRILTSGSLLLALSYGVPAVIPAVGMTQELLEGREAGLLYDGAGGAEALEAALRQMLAAKDSGRLAAMAANARKLAEATDWPDFTALLTD